MRTHTEQYNVIMCVIETGREYRNTRWVFFLMNAFTRGVSYSNELFLFHLSPITRRSL